MNILSKEEFQQLSHRRRALYVVYLTDVKKVKIKDLPDYGVTFSGTDLNNLKRLAQLWKVLPATWRNIYSKPAPKPGHSTGMDIDNMYPVSMTVIRLLKLKSPYRGKLDKIPSVLFDLMVRSAAQGMSPKDFKLECYKLCGMSVSSKVDSAAGSTGKARVHVNICHQLMTYIKGEWQQLRKTAGNVKFVMATLPGPYWGFEDKFITELDINRDIKYRPTLELYGIECDKKIVNDVFKSSNRPNCAFVAHATFDKFIETDYHLDRSGKCLSLRRPRRLPVKLDAFWADVYKCFTTMLARSFAITIHNNVDQGFAIITFEVDPRGRGKDGTAALPRFFADVSPYTQATDVVTAIKESTAAVIRETTNKRVVLTYCEDYMGGNANKTHMITLCYAVNLDVKPENVIIRDRLGVSAKCAKRKLKVPDGWTYGPKIKEWSKTIRSGVTGEL